MILKSLKNVQLPRIEPPVKGFYKDNRKRFLDIIKSAEKIDNKGLLFLKGPIEQPIYDDDMEFIPVPENLFLYLFGVAEPDTYGILDFQTGNALLFVRLADPTKSFWMKTKSLEEFRTEFEVDDAQKIEDLEDYLNKNVDKENQTIYIYKGINRYSGLESLNPYEEFKKLLANFNVNQSDIYQYACEARVRKSDEEIKLLSQAAEIGCIAHRSAMKTITPGMTEQQISNHFSAVTRYFANSTIPYENIVGAGRNASFLHYSPSSLEKVQDGQMVLIDAGARIFGYCSDITRSYPVNGKFTKKQAAVYNIVLKAQKEVFDNVKPGVSWQQMHIIAEKTILAGLKELGLIKGELDDMWNKRLSYYFFPHGLGHYLGLYVHDLPGLDEKENDWIPYEKMSLRVKRKLEKGMVLTNEPGIYFNDILLNEGYKDAKVAPFFDKELISEYQKEVSGIRIEDDFIVTEDGYKILSSLAPKTVEEIEKFMADKE